jgi:integrase
MATTAKRGRKQNPHQTSWGEIIPGLARLVDGRWYILATGKRFSESDERAAVKRFRQMTAASTTVAIPLRRIHPLSLEAQSRLDEDGLRARHIVELQALADEPVLWEWFREQILSRPSYVADHVHIPQLANFADMPIKQTLNVARIRATYDAGCPITRRSKNEALAIFDKLIASTGAKTLDDLTTEKLLAFKNRMENSGRIKSAGTLKGYFGRIKSIIAYGKKEGLNTATIDACLSRMAVLWTKKKSLPKAPKTIAPNDFWKIYDAANDLWKTFLMVALNLCMSMDEVCSLRWADFNLAGKSYASFRGKTSVARAAALWDETVALLKALPRKSEYVFTSTHGTRFNRNTKVNDFRELADSVGLVKVTFSQIKKGAYSAALKDKTVKDGRFARVLGGHIAHGLEDNYGERSVEYATPACDAVYRHYFANKAMKMAAA